MVIQWDTVALFCIMAASGFFGGMISSILDHMYEKHAHGKNCPDCSPGILFCRGIIGLAGSSVVVFLLVWLDKMKLTFERADLFVLVGLCVLSGTCSFRLLPKLGRKLENQLLREEILKGQEMVRREVISYTREQASLAMEYSSAMAFAREVLDGNNGGRDNQRRAIAMLEKLLPSFVADRPLNIYLGRLYRWSGDLNRAILTLGRYIENLGSTVEGKTSEGLYDRSVGLYNISCYKVLKAKEIQESGGLPADVLHAASGALASLEETCEIWARHAQEAEKDKDYDFLKNSPDFAEAFDALVKKYGS